MLSKTYRAVGPIARVGLRCYATWRLDWVIALGVGHAVPVPVLGFVVQRAVRLWTAARIASGSASGTKEEDSTDPPSKDGPHAGQRPARKATGPKGLPALPPRPSMRALLPAPDHSTQPLGLPMNLLVQTAARGPLYRWQGNRLLRGLLGLAATMLLCRGFPIPFTGRKAWLPPRLFEEIYHKVLGPVAAMSYLYSDPTQLQAASLEERRLCAKYEPTIREAYQRMRDAGAAEAKRLGRSVAFAAPGAEGSVQAIHSNTINACCLPGGIVFVNSGLIKAMGGSQEALSFVVGHEVGHAIGRHSLEKATLVYGGMFAIDAIIGLVQRLLEGGASRTSSVAWGKPPTRPTSASGTLSSLRNAPTSTNPTLASLRGVSAARAGPDEQEWEGEGEEGCGEGLSAGACRALRALDAALQSGLYMLQLQQSRRHEYEADQLALHLGTHAGMDRSWLASGAQQTLKQFIRMEAQGAFQQFGGPQEEQPDNPLSTHPAAINRLRRLGQLFKSGGVGT